MLRLARWATVCVALCVGLAITVPCLGRERVIRLSVGSMIGTTPIHIQYDGSQLSTTGPQATPVEFLNFLDSIPDISTPTATFTLNGLVPSGSPIVIAGSITQIFNGGSFSLYHPDSTLLLSGDLNFPALAGTAGLGSGGLLTTSLSTITGGTLQHLLLPGSLVLQMHLSNINGGAGLSASGGVLQPFTANVTVDIEADPIPEPATAVLMMLVGAYLLFTVGRSRLEQR